MVRTTGGMVVVSALAAFVFDGLHFQGKALTLNFLRVNLLFSLGFTLPSVYLLLCQVYVILHGSDHHKDFRFDAFAVDPERGKPSVRALWDSPIPSGHWRYYDGMLYMLGLLHVSGNFKIYTHH